MSQKAFLHYFYRNSSHNRAPNRQTKKIAHDLCFFVQINSKWIITVEGTFICHLMDQSTTCDLHQSIAWSSLYQSEKKRMNMLLSNGRRHPSPVPTADCWFDNHRLWAAIFNAFFWSVWLGRNLVYSRRSTVSTHAIFMFFIFHHGDIRCPCHTASTAHHVFYDTI